jgi:hypothetical protein
MQATGLHFLNYDTKSGVDSLKPVEPQGFIAVIIDLNNHKPQTSLSFNLPIFIHRKRRTIKLLPSLPFRGRGYKSYNPPKSRFFLLT